MHNDISESLVIKSKENVLNKCEVNAEIPSA